MSADGGSATAAAHVARGFWSRTFRGFTWTRLAIFCGVVSIACVGHAVTNLLMPDRTLLSAAKSFVWQFFYLSLLFGAVWVAVIMVGNWAPKRTVPRVLALAAAVAVGLVLSNLVTHDLLILMYKPDQDEQTFLKQISASVL
ncbi:MAG: hypothetical protein ABI624_11805, partial [Casimicrobiaceae bacterium]